MIVPVFAFTLALMPSQAKGPASAEAAPVQLSRVFAKGEKLQYAISSNLHVEERRYGFETFMPQDVDLNYKFTTEVKELKSDGIAVIHYQRPNMVQVDGESYNAPAKTTVEKVDMNYDLTVSPINKILDFKDLNPPKKKKPGKDDGDDGDGYPLMARGRGKSQAQLGAFLGQFIGEMYRLALNVGSMDSALDFAPKLPLDEVKVGDTWKETVSYQPQKLKGKDGKQAVQRLDYTFTYKGLVTVNGKQYYRVNAALDLNTDLAAYINQIAAMRPDQTGLKSIPLVLKQSIDYDLDTKTKRTVAARSQAEGGFKINITEVLDEPVIEEKLTGTTEMHLVSSATAAASTAAAPKKHGGKTGH